MSKTTKRARTDVPCVAADQLNAQLASDDQMTAICDAGVGRHRRTWLAANQAVVNTLLFSEVDIDGQLKKFDVSRPRNKELMSLLVLRILDKVGAP